jgi:hypothetical protein
MTRELVFKDALPDLIIGLIGIPIAISLQTVVEATWHFRELRRQWEGLRYFVLIIMFYALYSAGLYVLFEIGLKLAERKNEKFWERYLVTRILATVPLTVIEVWALIGIGVTFENPLARFLNLPLDPGRLALIACVEPLILVGGMLLSTELKEVIKGEYSTVLAYYTLVLMTGFVFIFMLVSGSSL